MLSASSVKLRPGSLKPRSDTQQSIMSGWRLDWPGHFSSVSCLAEELT